MSARSFALAAIFFALIAATSDARADKADKGDRSDKSDKKDARTQACLDASLRGQKLQDTGALVAARAAMLSCAQSECPAVVQTSCTEWALALEARIPTFVPAAEDRGADLTDVTVLLDGAVVATSLDGKPVMTDPGQHTIEFRTRGGARGPSQVMLLMVVLAEGEQRRIVRARFTPSVEIPKVPSSAANEAPRAGPSSAWTRPLPIALASLSAAGFLTLGIVGLHAKSRLDGLHDTCAPHCTQAEFDVVRRESIVADVGLGIGVAALVAAGVVVATTRTSGSTSATATPLPGGAFAAIHTAF